MTFNLTFSGPAIVLGIVVVILGTIDVIRFAWGAAVYLFSLL